MSESELEKSRKFFINDRFAMPVTGIEIDEVGDYYAKCSLVIQDKHLNAAGKVMGGAIFTLSDFTFAVATNHNGEAVVTSTSSITYLGAAKGTKLISESRLIKNGKTTCTYEISITDDKGTAVALVISNGIKILPKA